MTDLFVRTVLMSRAEIAVPYVVLIVSIIIILSVVLRLLSMERIRSAHFEFLATKNDTLVHDLQVAVSDAKTETNLTRRAMSALETKIAQLENENLRLKGQVDPLMPLNRVDYFPKSDKVVVRKKKIL